jgi:hypothetical protein
MVRAEPRSPLRASAGRAPGDRHRTRTRGVFAAADIAVAVALLIGVGLLARSFCTLRCVDLGVNLDRVQTFSLSLPEAR